MGYFIILVTFFSLFIYLYKFHKKGNVLLVLPIFYNFVVLYVVLGVTFLKYATSDPFHLYEQISDNYIYSASWAFIVASFSFYLGVALVKNKSKNKFLLVIERDVRIKYQKTLIFMITTSYLLYIAGYGWEGLLSRRGYVDPSIESNRTILTLFFVLAPFSMALIPFIEKKILKLFIYFLCFLVLISASSRFVVMLPFLYIIGTFLRYNKVGFFVVFLNISLIALSLIFVLQIRYYTFHGLIPNLTALFTKGLDSEYLFLGFNYAFSFSLFGVSYVLKNFTHDGVAFLISINPLPSRFLNIEYMLAVQEMKKTAPMSALAVLSLAGYPTLISFYFITGYCFSFIFNKMKGITFWYYAVVGLFILFCLFSIQYNLRGLSRFFYYSILIYLFHITFKKVKIKKKA